SGAVGGVIGAVLANRLKTWLGAGLTMAIMTLLSGVALMIAGLLPVAWAGALGLALSSFAVTIWNILVMSIRQSFIPGRLLGRVHGAWRTVLWGTMPLGALIGGLLGRIDLTVPLIVGGAVILVVSVIFFRFLMSLPNPEDIDNGDALLPTDGEAGPT